MSKGFKKIKEKFFNKSFLIFCLIGFVNTLVNSVVLKVSLTLFAKGFDVESLDDLGQKSTKYLLAFGLSTFIAFAVSSVVSYFANAKFTYKQKANKKNALYSAIAFISRFLLTYIFTVLFYALVKVIFTIESDPGEWIKTIVNIVVSSALVPPFFLVFKKIFKTPNTKEVTEEVKETEDIKEEISNGYY